MTTCLRRGMTGLKPGCALEAGRETAIGDGESRGGPVATGSAQARPFVFLTGDTRGGWAAAQLPLLGWGRMLIASPLTPYPDEPIGIDNGAFAAWANAEPWDALEYWERVQSWQDRFAPYLAVCPDKVADPDSLRFSLGWRERLDGIAWPWYLAVQDGMSEAAVREALPDFAGLFLGGTKRWKRRTAGAWARVAREAGVRAHYGRCGTETDLRAALRFRYDSADSAFVLWTRERCWQTPAPAPRPDPGLLPVREAKMPGRPDCTRPPGRRRAT